MNEYYIAWWNVENLFSVEGDPARIPWLAERLKADLKGWSRSVLKTKPTDPEPCVLVIGDFNDEPFNRSLTEYALSERTDRRVRSLLAENPYLFNLTWNLMSEGAAAQVYQNQGAMLDQMLANRGLLLDESPLQIEARSIEIVRFAEHLDRRGTPRRSGLPSRKGSYDKTGFSGHFPVACRVLERDA